MTCSDRLEHQYYVKPMGDDREWIGGLGNTHGVLKQIIIDSEGRLPPLTFSAGMLSPWLLAWRGHCKDVGGQLVQWYAYSWDIAWMNPPRPSETRKYIDFYRDFRCFWGLAGVELTSFFRCQLTGAKVPEGCPTTNPLYTGCLQPILGIKWYKWLKHLYLDCFPV